MSPTLPCSEILYCWIDVLDLKGDGERFGPFRVKFTGSKEPMHLGSVPNPVEELTRFRFYLPELSDAVFEICGPDGRTVSSPRAANLGVDVRSFIWVRRYRQGRLVAKATCFYVGRSRTRLQLSAGTRSRTQFAFRDAPHLGHSSSDAL
jgi:hypothetical protein